jgi:hypothetical protein
MSHAVLLFLDRLPLYSWVPPGSVSDVPLLSACLPLVVTDPDSPPRTRARAQRWAVDSRFTGEAYAWRHHLVAAGLDPDMLRHGSAYLTPVQGRPQELPLRRATLWLLSNLPALRDRPYRIELGRGIAFRDVGFLPNPESNCPLLGMRALEMAGLKVMMDFDSRAVSVWVPGSPYRSGWLTARRVASGFARVPVAWE